MQKGKRKKQVVESFPRSKQKRWNIKRVYLYGGIMFICFMMLIVGVYSFQYFQKSAELEKYQKELARIEEENKELEKEIERLYDEEYIEFLARRHFGLIKSEE